MDQQTKMCAGTSKWGQPPHEAPRSAFVSDATPDGLYRICRGCDARNQYAYRVRKAAAAKNEPITEAEVLAQVNAWVERSALKSLDAAERTEPGATLGTAGAEALAKANAAEQAERTLAAIEHNGGHAYTEAIGTDEGQAALEAAAKASLEARRAAWRDAKRAQRAAAKAKAASR